METGQPGKEAMKVGTWESKGSQQFYLMSQNRTGLVPRPPLFLLIHSTILITLLLESVIPEINQGRNSHDDRWLFTCLKEYPQSCYIRVIFHRVWTTGTIKNHLWFVYFLEEHVMPCHRNYTHTRVGNHALVMRRKITIYILLVIFSNCCDIIAAI